MKRKLLWLRFYTRFLGAVRKVCRFLNISFCYATRYGVNESDPVFPAVGSQEERTLDPASLRLGLDYLKDEYTLLGTPVTESPHYALMRSLQEGRGYEDTEYCRRMLAGSLDERPPIVAYYLNPSYFPGCFARCVREIESDSYEPILVYRVDGAYYIHDGKHHAAVAALLGRPLRCRVANCETIYCSLSRKLCRYVDRHRAYARHKSFLNALREMDK